jgi:hypothetical protein
MIRIINEFLHPERKCERVGHMETSITIKIRRRSNDSYYVVEDFKASARKCRRCHALLGIDDQVFITGYTGCSMPTFMWDAIREKGYCIL